MTYLAPTPAPTIIVATANVYHSTPVPPLVAMLETIFLDQLAELAFLQETGPEIVDLAGAMGIQLVRWGECAVAWNPAGPHGLEGLELSVEKITLSDSAFYRPGGKRPVRPKMPTVIVVDRWGRSIKAGSYHTPSNVDRGAKGPNTKLQRRLDVLEESAQTWGSVARGAVTHSVVLAGDDNTHDKGHPAWEKLIGRAVTGLRVVEPDEGTKGNRTIDGFRVRHFRPVRAWTLPGLGAESNPHDLTFAELRHREPA